MLKPNVLYCTLALGPNAMRMRAGLYSGLSKSIMYTGAYRSPLAVYSLSRSLSLSLALFTRHAMATAGNIILRGDLLNHPSPQQCRISQHTRAGACPTFLRSTIWNAEQWVTSQVFWAAFGWERIIVRNDPGLVRGLVRKDDQGSRTYTRDLSRH